MKKTEETTVKSVSKAPEHNHMSLQISSPENIKLLSALASKIEQAEQMSGIMVDVMGLSQKHPEAKTITWKIGTTAKEGESLYMTISREEATGIPDGRYAVDGEVFDLKEKTE
jgi:hypothetical protein